MSTEHRIDDLPLSGIVPSKKGSTAVLRASLALFIGWLGVWLAEIPTDSPFQSQETQEAMSSGVYLLYTGLQAGSNIEFYVALVTPLLLLSLLDLPRGRRLLAALVGGAVLTAPFSTAGEIATSMRHAALPAYEVHPDVWYYVSGATDGLVNGVLMALAFGVMVAVPFFIATSFAERATSDDYTAV
jgi:hypothetical protein